MLRTTSISSVLLLAFSLAIALAGCSGSGQGKNEREGHAAVRSLTDQPAPAPAVVYVQPFQLQDAPGSGDDGGLHPLRLFRQVRSDLNASGVSSKLADVIVRDLQAGGLDARLLDSSAPLPSHGWLVRGVFIQYEPDGSVMPAVLGNAMSKRPVELVVGVDNLAEGTLEPLYSVRDTGGAIDGPGLPAPNPYAAAAKFVVKIGQQQNDAEKLGRTVADEILDRARAAKNRT